MGRIKPRKSRARYYTPPPELSAKEGHATTPQRTAVIVAKCISQAINTLIPQSVLRDLTNLPERTRTRILAEKEVRTRHNQQHLGPEPRGPKELFYGQKQLRSLITSMTRMCPSTIKACLG